MDIYTFDGDNSWLSNYFPAEFTWDGITWQTSEHAYQVAKVIDFNKRKELSLMNGPARIKRLVKELDTSELRTDWETVKLSIMKEIVQAKFDQNPDLKQKLLDTGTGIIEEGNHWSDTFWGISPVKSNNGLNHLGIILMDLRNEYRLGLTS